MRSKAKSLVWGEASNASGKTVTANFTCADGYTLTALSSLIIAKKVLEGNFKPGYQTPAILLWRRPCKRDTGNFAIPNALAF